MKFQFLKRLPMMIIGLCMAVVLTSLSASVNAAEEGEPRSSSTNDTSVTAEASTEEGTSTETKIPDNPFTDGMMSDDELYKYITDYLDVDTTLDLDGSGVLIDESILNPSGGSESETGGNDGETAANETAGSDTSGEKLMYTIATRDGSTFYIIIDKNSGGENVYFLNKVDITDLASLIGRDKDEDSLTNQEKEIIAAADGITVKPADKTPSSGDDNSDVIPDSSQFDDTNSNANNKKSSGGYTMYIIIGVAMVVAIIIGWYFKIGPGKKKKTNFADEEDYEDEEEAAQENYINEDEIEDEDDDTE